MAGGDGFFAPLPGTAGGDAVLDWVSVVNHDAVGDGTTDDTAAIQAAVNATPRGGTCYFPVPAVEYKITAAITCPKPIRLLGGNGHPYQLSQGSRIKQATANTSAFVSPTTGSENWSVEGLAILGTIGGQTGGAAIESSQSVIVNRCYTSGFQDGVRITVDDIDDDHAYYAAVQYSWFDSASRAGLRLVGIVNNFTWLGCRAVANGAAAVQVVGGPIGVRFLGGDISGSPVSLDIDGADTTGATSPAQPTLGVLVSGVYMENYDGNTDIRIGNTATVYAVRIESCQFIKPNFTGGGWHIAATNVDGLTIEDNEFTSTQVANITSPATNVTYGRNHNRVGGTITLPAGTIRTDSANVTPEPVGDTASAGTSHYLARADHVHEGATEISADQIRDAGRWEVVVDGNPAAAITTPDGTDWVYGWITT